MDHARSSPVESGPLASTPYDNRFFDDIDRASLSSAEAVVPLVRDLVPARTVVDVGCGRGAWLRTFKAHGAETISGYDGAYVDPAKLLIPRDAFTAIDLSAPLTITGRYDLAVCLEVGEHLPQRSARSLVQTLCQLAPAILFSAAVPGQGGTHHINEQWPHFWAHLFEERGFVRLDPIRRQVFSDPRVATHYKQNAFLYVDRNLVATNERLREESRLDQMQDVTVISLNRLVPFYSVTGMLGELFRVIARSVRNRLGA